MNAQQLAQHVTDVLDERKGEDIVTIDVSAITQITDRMVIVSGTSSRHVKSLVDYVAESVKKAGLKVRGIEGKETLEWVLVDLGDVLLHVMQAEPRRFYDLERLWTEMPTDSESSV